MPPASLHLDGDTSRPLLTIAVPTFNRAQYLTDLLAILEPQLAALPQVELFVSDNASEDRTQEVIADASTRFAACGARLRTHRHAVNIGSDANFASCYHAARGHFFWMCGDDDIIVPGALARILPHLEDSDGHPADLDLLYATSYGFRSNFATERHGDPFHRDFHTIRNPRTLAMVVNIMFTFISGIIVNKDRLESFSHEDPDAFIGTNLVQLSWTLPLLLHHRRSIVLWTRPIAARVGNAEGYSLGSVFGEHLAANVARVLPGRSDLSGPIINFALRRWFPSVLVDARRYNNTLQLDEAHHGLRAAFGRNPRYWLFTWPALRLPLPLARLYTSLTAVVSKLIYIVHLPGFWRKQTK
jgi:abequosyltransferase